MSRSFNIGTPAFLPSDDRRRVQVIHEGASGQTVATVYAIGNDDFLQDFTNERPIIGPYRPFYDLSNGGGRSLGVVEGRARFETYSSAEEEQQVTMNYLGQSERIESVLELASESSIAGGAPTEENTVRIRLGGVLYNDTANGGFNESEGSIFALTALQSDAEAGVALEYCAYRSNTADFSDNLELVMEGGTDCGSFDIDAAYDTPYAVSIALDREAGALVFDVNGSERRLQIQTPIFTAPEEQFIGVQAHASGGSTVVAYADNFGTSSNAPLVSGQ